MHRWKKRIIAHCATVYVSFTHQLIFLISDQNLISETHNYALQTVPDNAAKIVFESPGCQSVDSSNKKEETEPER